MLLKRGYVQDILDRFESVSGLQRLTGGAVSAVKALLFPNEGTHLSTFGELTSDAALAQISRRMREDPVGRIILIEQPRVRSPFVDFAHLRGLPQNTFGKQYIDMMDSSGLDPDCRPVVKHIQDLELAYVYQRYKEIHDFLHLILRRRTSVTEEIELKVFEFTQLRLLSAAAAACFGPLRLTPQQQLAFFSEHWITLQKKAEKSKFCMNVYYEQHFEEDMSEFRRWFFKGH